jgi:SAM-dependent methyltransferase
MQETSKCRPLREKRGDFEKYLHGNGIDVGCGNDCLQIPQGTVKPWDEVDGDANLLAGVANDQFDFVYSSHCLEHMRDVREALTNWIRVLKPGGYLYFTVPDYILYEKMTFPSRFNRDHKQTFSFLLPRQVVRRENHFHIEHDMKPLLSELGVDLLRATVEDWGFDYNEGIVDQTGRGAMAQLCFVGKKRGGGTA